MGSHAQVIDNPARSRFELALPGGATAFIDYTYRDVAGTGRAGPEAGATAPEAGGAAPRVRVLTHAEVPAQLRGAGIGAQLAAGVLELLRARGERVVPVCPYVVDFIHRHPQYADVVAR
ncbi:MAG TPA: GNAT family N-acetyltransferase [Steroidobacteraceae bacterium]|nr:GNAT family N-acetyltransferase [Steroidobacteraceae bacterium]